MNTQLPFTCAHTGLMHQEPQGTNPQGTLQGYPPYTGGPGSTGDQLKTWKPQSCLALSLVTDAAMQLFHTGEQVAH